MLLEHSNILDPRNVHEGPNPEYEIIKLRLCGIAFPSSFGGPHSRKYSSYLEKSMFKLGPKLGSFRELFAPQVA